VIERLRPRLSYANVTATIALFAALGGTGYAAATLPRNSVGSKQLRSHAVTNSKLAAHSITASRIKADTLTGAQIAEGTLAKVPAAANADHAATADSLGGVTATDLKTRCPSGTVLYGGSCFETAQRHPDGIDWQTATRLCAADGRRLPDAGELVAFGRQTAISFAGFEWTSDFAADDTHAITAENGGIAQQRPIAEAHPFRCVAPMTN
jgi:hypothetical protein